MRFLFVLSSFSTLVAAFPQAIDYAAVEAAPDPTAGPADIPGFNIESAIASLAAEVTLNPISPSAAQETSAVKKRGVVDAAGYSSPFPLNAAINAPLDVQDNNKDTYMGYKLINNGSPFDTRLCAGLCDAQSAYNLRHPPKTGAPRTCQFFVTYELWKVASDGDKYQGQYCTMYTRYWNESYAKNYAAKGYRLGTVVSLTNLTDNGIPIYASDVSTMKVDGGEFCTSYISYQPPVSTVSVTVTPDVVTARSTQVQVSTYTVETTAVETQYVDRATIKKRVDGPVATPALVQSWYPAKISSLCSLIATGTATTTFTNLLPTPVTTVVETRLVSTAVTQVISSTVIITTGSPTPTNMISRGDFEDNTWGIWNLYTSSEASTYGVETTGKSGNGGFIKVLPGMSGRPGYLYLSLPLYRVVIGENIQYRFTMDVKYDNNQCTLRVLTQGNDTEPVSYPIWVYDNSNQPIGVWQTLTGTFIGSKNMYLILLLVSCAGSASTNIHFDNFDLRRVSSTVYTVDSPATGNNLVTNPGFEDGTFAPAYNIETSYSSYSLGATGNGGRYGLVLSLRPAQGFSYGFISQSITPAIVEGKVYRLSIDVNPDQTMTSQCRLSASLIRGGVAIQAFRPTGNLIPINKWTTLAGFVTGSGPGTTLSINIYCSGSPASVNVYLDNFLLVPVS